MIIGIILNWDLISTPRITVSAPSGLWDLTLTNLDSLGSESGLVKMGLLAPLVDWRDVLLLEVKIRVLNLTSCLLACPYGWSLPSKKCGSATAVWNNPPLIPHSPTSWSPKDSRFGSTCGPSMTPVWSNVMHCHKFHLYACAVDFLQAFIPLTLQFWPTSFTPKVG